ncbi:MAG: rhodanese-like domain-containing protein [Deltaproteobacteria bacterium]|nr:rhodanese-like domain-containing protein [Deltaproteobacteria bacterium]
MKNALRSLLTALGVQKERIVSVDDLYREWQEVREKKSKAVLLDVRTPEEFAGGHVPGAINIPSGNPSLATKTWPDPETEIWVYCRTQGRSSSFASSLRKSGYRNIHAVHGGITAWAEKGYPIDN